MYKNIILLFILMTTIFGCNSNKKLQLFEYVDSSKSNIIFSNTIVENNNVNGIDCLNCYNGGGVGIGDFNNDGLSDFVLTGNQVSSKIFLNKGDLQFEDISISSNFSTKTWITGVSIVDINSDGYDDIYLNVGSGGLKCDGDCSNLLFINNGLNKNGIPTFTEQAKAYGLDDGAYSHHSVFFDYDMDGDLDVYIVHNSNLPFSEMNNAMPKHLVPEYLIDGMFRNDTVEGIDHPVFTDVSKELNISHKGFGLGIGITDFNNDNLIDVYVSNDFISDDFLYINKAHKDSLAPTFSEESKQYVSHQTLNGMGMDIADINNDNLPDILVLDMFPKEFKKQKRMMGSMNYDLFINMEENDYSYQYVRNTLQLSNGILEGKPVKSSEVGFLTGITSTDWSWAPLMVDFDNDSDKDIYVTNGFHRNILDIDNMNTIRRKMAASAPKNKKSQLKKSLDALPPIQLPNFFFEQKEDNTFKDVSLTWTKERSSFSNGVAYADFDLDGDLDLVVNNINEEAFLLENKTSDKLDNNYLRIKLKGDIKNANAIGSKITLWNQGESQFQFQSVIRGYLSSMEPIIHFGVKTNTIDSINIVWPNGKISKLKNIKANQVLELNQASARIYPDKYVNKKKLFNLTEDVLNFKHQENIYNEFTKEHLLMRQYSQSGPCIAVANFDGKPGDEVFIGGSTNVTGKLWFQDDYGIYNPKQDLDSIYEDTDAVFFDVDNDSDLDL